MGKAAHTALKVAMYSGKNTLCALKPVCWEYEGQGDQCACKLEIKEGGFKKCMLLP